MLLQNKKIFIYLTFLILVNLCNIGGIKEIVKANDISGNYIELGSGIEQKQSGISPINCEDYFLSKTIPTNVEDIFKNHPLVENLLNAVNKYNDVVSAFEQIKNEEYINLRNNYFMSKLEYTGDQLANDLKNGKIPEQFKNDMKKKQGSPCEEINSGVNLYISGIIQEIKTSTGDITTIQNSIINAISAYCSAIAGLGNANAQELTDSNKQKLAIIACFTNRQSQTEIIPYVRTPQGEDTIEGKPSQTGKKCSERTNEELKKEYRGYEIAKCNQCNTSIPLMYNEKQVNTTTRIDAQGMCCARDTIVAKNKDGSIVCCHKNNVSPLTLECCPAGVSDEGECLVNNYGQMGLYCTPEQLIQGTCRLETYKFLGIRKSNQKPDVGLFISDIVLAATSFIGTIVTIALLVSGFRYVMAATGGDDTKNAQLGIKYSLIGLFLVAFSYAIIRLIQYIAKG